MSTPTNRSYLVKVVAGKSDTTRVWNPKKPMTVGHGFRWVIEQKADGVSVRALDSKEGSLPKKAVEELFLKHSEIAKSASVCLAPGARPSEDFRIELRPITTLEPVFSEKGTGSSLRVFYCKKDWAIELFALTSSFVAVENKKKIFKLKGNANGVYSAADTVEVQSLVDGLKLVTGKNSETIAKGEKRRISFGYIADSTLVYAGSTWRFAGYEKTQVSDLMTAPAGVDSETKLMNKILKGAAVATLILGLITWLVPSRPPEVAEQKVRIILPKKKVVAGTMTAAPKGDPSAKDLSIGKSGSSKNPGRKGTPKVAKTKKVAPAGKQTKRYSQVSKSSKPKASKKKKTVKVAKSSPKASPKKSKKRSHVVASSKKASTKRTGSRSSSVAAALPKSELFKTLSSASFRNTAKRLSGAGAIGGSNDSYASARAMGSSGGGTGAGSLGDADGVSTRSASISGFGGGAGNGDGGPGSAGAGYGRGSYSKVSGQGRSFVSLDTGASDVDEGLTREQIGRVIHAHRDEIRYCYESAKLRSPDLEGKMVMKFSVGAPGNVKTAGVGSSTVSSARLHDCIVGRLKHWKFPKPKGGVTVAVAYPLFFKTLER